MTGSTRSSGQRRRWRARASPLAPTSPTRPRCWRCSPPSLPRLGGLDILVNNAGILIEKPLLDTTAEDFDRLIAVNLRGAFLVGREAMRVMVRQGSGRVINVASELAYLGRENCSRSTAPPRGASCR